MRLITERVARYDEFSMTPLESRRWQVPDDVLAVGVGTNGRTFVAERDGRVSDAALER